MIKFYKETTLNVIERFNEDTGEIEDECIDTFKADELVCADIVKEEDGICMIQYGDGCVSVGVPRDSFEVL